MPLVLCVAGMTKLQSMSLGNVMLSPQQAEPDGSLDLLSALRGMLQLTSLSLRGIYGLARAPLDAYSAITASSNFSWTIAAWAATPPSGSTCSQPAGD